jgi:hypothetical protein
VQGAAFIIPGQEQVEERNDRAFKLGSTASVDGGGGEGLPDDGFTDVGGDEEGDARSKTVSFLEKLVEEDHDHGRGDKLDNEEKTDAGAEITGLAVQPR